MDENKSLWNKTQDEITVGDVLKLNGIVLVATIGTVAVITFGAVAVEKLSDKRRIQKAKKAAKKNTDLTVVE